MPKKITRDDIIKRFREKHGDKYDYKLVIYVNIKTPVDIICPLHGIFNQLSNSHLNSDEGCPKCSRINFSNKQRDTKETFIEKAKIKHGSKYSYDFVIYIDCSTKVDIWCNIHGIFQQIPASHVAGKGCLKCAYISSSIKQKDTTEIFIEKARLKHGDKYNYQYVIYRGTGIKVDIICPFHGLFSQDAGAHLQEKGCLKCGINSSSIKRTFTTKEFIERARLTHGQRYGYDSVVYICCVESVDIKCPQHGIFSQIANTHISGGGCPKCNYSKGEHEIMKILNELKVIYVSQHTFSDCKYLRKLKFDFYLTDLNICIEVDGEQHERPITYFGGEDAFKELQIRDKIKDEYCVSNNILLLRISHKINLKEYHSLITKLIECTKNPDLLKDIVSIKGVRIVRKG